MLDNVEPPDRGLCEYKIRQLIEGSLTRLVTSEWASGWIKRIDEIRDARVREAIVALGMVDMPSTDREFLYDKADFQAWLDDLNS